MVTRAPSAHSINNKKLSILLLLVRHLVGIVFQHIVDRKLYILRLTVAFMSGAEIPFGPPVNTPVTRLIRALAHLKIEQNRELNQRERGHQTRLRDIDRQYWADKAQLEQQYQQRRAEECQQYQQTVRDIRHNQEVAQRDLYREAEQAEQARRQAEVQENLEVEEEEQPEEPHVVVVHRDEVQPVNQVQQDPEILAEAQPIGVVAEEQEHEEVQEAIPDNSRENPREQNLPQAQPVARRLRVAPVREVAARQLAVGSRVGIRNGIRLADHIGLVHNQEGRVTRITEVYIHIEVWNPRTNHHEVILRQEQNVRLIE